MPAALASRFSLKADLLPVVLRRLGFRVLPAGVYEVVTDEELIEGLSFPVYRRVATMIMAPAQSSQPSIEMLTIDPQDLATAMKRDTLAVKGASVSEKLT